MFLPYTRAAAPNALFSLIASIEKMSHDNDLTSKLSLFSYFREDCDEGLLFMYDDGGCGQLSVSDKC